MAIAEASLVQAIGVPRSCWKAVRSALTPRHSSRPQPQAEPAEDRRKFGTRRAWNVPCLPLTLTDLYQLSPRLRTI